MKRKILSAILALSLCMSMLPAVTLTATAAISFDGGDGTAENPYQISTAEQLASLADAVNGGNDLYGVYFKQTGDINLGGKDDPWPVIGHVIGNTPHPFNGVFDGGNFKISGLFVGTTDEDGEPVGLENEDAGLFGHVGEKGIIRRVHVVDCKVYSKGLYLGGIAGRNEGLVEYCSSDATDPDNSSGVIKGKWQYAGGIVGYNFGTISYCYSNCDVYGAQKVGGITGGQNGGTVVNCYFRGYVYADDITRAYAGGIAGENDGDSTIDNCYSDAIVEGRNNNEYCGVIAGSNDTGSTVENCFWESSEDTELPGIASGMGTVKNVEERTADEFASGQVAWELAHGTNGSGWGQNMYEEDEEKIDKHPHFTDVPDKELPTTPVYRVTLKAYSINIDETLYVDPGTDIDLTKDKYKLPNNQSQWYIVDADGNGVLGPDGEPLIFNGDVTDHDVDAVGGERITFGGKTDTYLVTGTYSPSEQTFGINLDSHMAYAEKGPSPEGRFEYEITDGNTLRAELSEDGKTLTIPEGTEAKEYTLTVNAHEKKPFISPLSIIQFDTEDVELNVKVVINKADPVITVKPEASTTIDYGNALSASNLSGGEAQHPTAGTVVKGTFAWTNEDTKPNVNEAAITGYPVTFTPEDTTNYNSVTTMVTLAVNKVDPTGIIQPTAKNRTYDGSIQNLIDEGSAEGGIMKYWLGDDAEYSSTIPSRANAGEYTVWYKVVGDENHNDTEPQYITVTISPYTINIDPVSVTYDGTAFFMVTLNGVNDETVIATLTPFSKNKGEYTYSTEAGNGKYTAELSSANYTIGTVGTLTINRRPAMLKWSDSLIFPYDGEPHRVTATVSNAIGEDTFDLKYIDNEKEDVSDDVFYTAIVTDLGNDNYTLENAQNVTQMWYIIEESEIVELNDVETVTYGDEVTFTANIHPATETNNISLMSFDDDVEDKVEFCVNGKPLPIADVVYTDDDEDVGTATSNKIKVTSENNFSAGSNVVTAEFSGNENVSGGMAAITVTVDEKTITAEITGDANATTKVYDGNEIATGLDLRLNGIEECDKKVATDVTVTADAYTYDNKNVGINKLITAQNVLLHGAQSGNYVLNDKPVTITGSITPKVIGLEWRGVNGLIYTGNPVNVNATAIRLIPGDECLITVENGQQTNADTYIATAKLPPGSNYALPDPEATPEPEAINTNVTQEYTIAPAVLMIPEQITVYDGTKEFNISVDGVTPTDGDTEKVAVKLIADSADAGVYTYGTGDNTYTANITNTNYNITGGAMLIINKAAINDLEKNITIIRDSAEIIETVNLTEIAGYPQNIGEATFIVNSTNNGLAVAAVQNGVLTLVTNNSSSPDKDTVTVTVSGMKNYEDFNITVIVDWEKPTVDPSPTPGTDPSPTPGTNPSQGSGLTDSNGNANVTDKADGKNKEYIVTVEDSKDKIKNAEVEIKDGKIYVTLPDSHELTKSNQTTVTVRDSDGNPVQNMTVIITDKNGKTESDATNSSGKVTLPKKTASGIKNKGTATNSPQPTNNPDVTDKDGNGIGETDENGKHEHSATEHKAYVSGYEDGTVRPDGNMTRAEAAAIFARNVAQKKGESITGKVTSFTDVSASAWYNQVISYLEDYNIIAGYENGTMRPEAQITRAEFTAMCIRFYTLFEKMNTSDNNIFTDVPQSHWASGNIYNATAMDWIKGYEDGTFRPDNNITRAEVVAIVDRMLGRKPNVDGMYKEMITWPDNTDVNMWYYADIQEASNSHEYDMGESYEIWAKAIN